MPARSSLIAAAVGCAITVLAIPCAAQGSPAAETRTPKVQSQDSAKFGSLPVLPSCLTFAVERGDPQTGASVLLIKMTRGCTVPWHWHSAPEELMLVSGKGKIEFPDSPARAVSSGGYVLLPATHHHQFSCQAACLFFDAISGPFDIHYVGKSGGEVAVAEALEAVDEHPPRGQ